jgi:hypothetical protein
MDIQARLREALTLQDELDAQQQLDPAAFQVGLETVAAEHPQAWLVQVWRERMVVKPAARLNWQLRDLVIIVGLSLLGWAYLKAPAYVPGLDQPMFIVRNFVLTLLALLIFYFLLTQPASNRLRFGLVVGLLATGLYLNWLPFAPDGRPHTSVLALLHAPILWWLLVALAFAGVAWPSHRMRMEYLRYNGEAVVYGSLVLLGGMVLTGVTLFLFQLIEMNVEQWYIENVALLGVVAAPLVATFIDRRLLGERMHVAPLLARIFSPLFLITLTVYLAMIMLQGRSPYTDRDFLIAFNGLLLLVLGISLFSIIERSDADQRVAGDYVTVALVLVTLVIDAVALSAIVYRLSAFGMTPNRAAVLGANVVIIVSLLGMLFHYVRFLRSGMGLAALRNWVAGYLPVYAAWLAVVTFVFPLLYRFQ